MISFHECFWCVKHQVKLFCFPQISRVPKHPSKKQGLFIRWIVGHFMVYPVLEHGPLMLAAELLQDPHRCSSGLGPLRKPGIPCKFTEAPCLPCSVSARSLKTHFSFSLCMGSNCGVLCSFHWLKVPGSFLTDSCQCSVPQQNQVGSSL